MQMSPEMPRPPQLCRPDAEDMDTITSMPSFRSISGRPYLPDLASGSPTEIPWMERFKQGGLDGDDGKEEFEFAFVYTGSPDGLVPVAADEVIFNGLLRPASPLFGRALFSNSSEHQRHGRCGDCDGERDSGDSARKSEEAVRVHLSKLEVERRELSSTSSSSSASSESDELDRVPSDTYCGWTPRSVPPSPEPRKKSRSAGRSSSKRWRLRDLVARRSHSAEREKLVPAEAAGKDVEKLSGDEKSCPAAEAAKEKGKGSGGGVVAETDMAAAHRLFYAKAGDRRRSSFLPYRKDLLGLFAKGERRGPQLSQAVG